MKNQNPFEIISPEDLDPKEIKTLFVKSYTELNILKNKKHTLIYGSRGNGKSMLLRFLEPKCQILDSGLSTKEYLESYNAFIGIYIPFKEGYLNKSDLLMLDDNVAYTLSKHLINLHIIGCFIDILSVQMNDLLSIKVERELTKRISNLLDNKRIHHLKKFNFKEIKDILLAEIRMIDDYTSKSSFPHFTEKYKGNFSDYLTFIKPLFQEIRNIIPLFKNISFYFLIDEGDRLFDFQKRYINTMLANRDHKYLSIKLASKIGGYDFYYTDSQTRIQEIHDYDLILLDELYTHSRNTYFNKIKEIANLRLKASGFDTDIDCFLPESKSENKLFKKIKKETEKEWEKIPQERRPELKDDYINKYATARLFQYLAQKKSRKRYSGFTNLVHFSSGIIRNFLHPAYNMFNKSVQKGHDFKKEQLIPETIQNDTLYKYSDDFFAELDAAVKGLGENNKTIKTRIVNLKKLINGLGNIYYKRLTDKNSRDPRIISFALKDDPDHEMKEILSYAVKESLFHKVYTGSKSGGGRLECFVLNRALCPAFKLDLSSLRGRILLSSRELWSLINSPHKIEKELLSGTSTESFLGQQDLFLFSEDGDDYV